MENTVPLLLFLFVCFLFVLVKSGEIYDNIPADHESVDSEGLRIVWDFIVVGAGASGNVVAARLANETNKRILLLEGGAIGTGQRDIGGTDYIASSFKTDPITGEQTLDRPLTRYDVPTAADSIRLASNALKNVWNITAVGPFFSQAKVIGGNQATNGLGWYPPQKYDLDQWGVPGFNSTEFWPYFVKIENAAETGFPDRGTSGLTNVKFASFLPLEQSRFINATVGAGYSNAGDMANGKVQTGYYYVQTNEKDGIRQTTSITYLKDVLEKTTFQFRTSAIVTRVLFDVLGNAVGVEYSDSCGRLKKVFALSEVVLAAGDLQTTKILYNSGIGPESILSAFGKPLRVVNEIIGQKTRNHQRSIMTFHDSSLLNANFYNYPAASVQYASTGAGIFDKLTVALEATVNEDSPYPDILITVGAAGTTPTDVYGQLLTLVVFLNTNKYANGTLNLTSSDPLAPTIFNANTFLLDDDATTVAKGFIETRRVMSFWNSSLTEIAPGPSVSSIEDLVSWIRANPATACHYYGSAPMGTDASSPTDERMRVKGVQKLRLVGPIVVPGPVIVGMQALAVALGEKGTDLIKEDYGL